MGESRNREEGACIGSKIWGGGGTQRLRGSIPPLKDGGQTSDSTELKKKKNLNPKSL